MSAEADASGAANADGGGGGGSGATANAVANAAGGVPMDNLPVEVSLVHEQGNTHYTSGLKCVKAERYEEAYHCFTKAIFLLPNEPVLYVARAESCVRLCDLASAVANYKKAIALQNVPDPSHSLRLAALLDCLGVLAFKASRFNKALHYADVAMQYSPKSRTIRLHRAIALFMLGRADEALVDIRACEGSDHCQPYAWVAKAVVLLLSKQYAASKQEVEKCLLVAPDHSLVTALEMLYDAVVNRYKGMAITAMEEERWVDAQEMLTTCIEVFPHDAELYLTRSTCHMAKREYTSAVQDLFESINRSGMATEESSRQLAQTLVRIAAELIEKTSYVQAITYCDEALRWDAHCMDAYLARGECQRMIGKHYEAMQDFTRVVEADPDNPDGIARLATLHSAWGIALYDDQKYAFAEKEFAKAIEYAPYEPVYYLNRAKCHMMTQEPAKAIQALVECRGLSPNDPNILNTLKSLCPPEVFQAVDAHYKALDKEAMIRMGFTVHPDEGGLLKAGLRQMGNSGVFIAPTPPLPTSFKGALTGAQKIAQLTQRLQERRLQVGAGGGDRSHRVEDGGNNSSSNNNNNNGAVALGGSLPPSAASGGSKIQGKHGQVRVVSTRLSRDVTPLRLTPSADGNGYTQLAGPKPVFRAAAGQRTLHSTTAHEQFTSFKRHDNHEIYTLRRDKGAILQAPYSMAAIRQLVSSQGDMAKAGATRARKAPRDPRNTTIDNPLWRAAAPGFSKSHLITGVRDKEKEGK